jgi:pyruvate/2-oxoglutarate dehydrogenase complex dihydrolipoamide acyltransferase (E2) component
MSASRRQLALPDLDLPGVTATATSWLADVGSRIVEGDRLVEISAGDVTVDLSAPASGTLAKRCVGIDQPLKTGQILAWIEMAD